MTHLPHRACPRSVARAHTRGRVRGADGAHRGGATNARGAKALGWARPHPAPHTAPAPASTTPPAAPRANAAAMAGLLKGVQRSVQKASYKLGLAEEPEPTLLETVQAEFSEATTMSYTTRFYGFCACFCVGILMSMLSSLFWGHPTKFGVTYTLGNLISICSMMFLFGPRAQIEGMTKSYRVFATFLYFLCMICTLVAALYVQDGFLTLICIVAQSAALTWYCLSYIPYARSIVARCCGSMMEDG